MLCALAVTLSSARPTSVHSLSDTLSRCGVPMPLNRVSRLPRTAMALHFSPREFIVRRPRTLLHAECTQVSLLRAKFFRCRNVLPEVLLSLLLSSR